MSARNKGIVGLVLLIVGIIIMIIALQIPMNYSWPTRGFASVFAIILIVYGVYLVLNPLINR